MQNELDQTHPELDIQIVGVNIVGAESGNAATTQGRDIPWLQDTDVTGPSGEPDGLSDVWQNSWNAGYRDVIILDGNNEKVGTYNLTTHNLEIPGNYDTLMQMLIDAATTPSDDFTLVNDVTSTRPGVAVDVLPLANDANSSHPGLTLHSVVTPAHGTAQVMTMTYSPDLNPKGQTAPLLISEISPGHYIELFNTANFTVNLGSVTQYLSSPFTNRSVASLSVGKSVAARGYVTIDWPSEFTDTDAGGEIILYRDNLTGFADAAKIDDFVAWGTNPHSSRLSLAVTAGKWTGAPAPALSQHAIHRLPGTTGTAAAAYETTRPTTPGETIDSHISTMQLVRYQPTTGFVGTETITYQARDSQGKMGTGQITVHVMESARLWQNPVDAADVDFNAKIQPLDALLVINGLNQTGVRVLPTSLQAPHVPPPFIDASGNGSLEPLDALQVINRINSDAAGEGEASLVYASTAANGQLPPANDSSTPIDRDTAANAAQQAEPLSIDPSLAAMSTAKRVDPSTISKPRTSAKQADNHSASLDPLVVDALFGES